MQLELLPVRHAITSFTQSIVACMLCGLQVAITLKATYAHHYARGPENSSSQLRCSRLPTQVMAERSSTITEDVNKGRESTRGTEFGYTLTTVSEHLSTPAASSSIDALCLQA